MKIVDDYYPLVFTEAATGGVLKNFGNFTGQNLCLSLFLVKLQA